MILANHYHLINKLSSLKNHELMRIIYEKYIILKYNAHSDISIYSILVKSYNKFIFLV